MPYQPNNHPPIADISTLSIQGSYRRIWHNVCFLFMLNGESQVEVDGHASYLNGNGIMLVEADTPFTMTGHGSNLVMIIRMDYDFFAQGKAGRGLGVLVCNSAEDGDELQGIPSGGPPAPRGGGSGNSGAGALSGGGV